ncbi:hypothetical protein O77CONTIG1_03634 [Leptolyngbya sp. O-77]|nr:hypothetical protein O77CONTIG1_03634 [Leptolyngbya sp. O-77]
MRRYAAFGIMQQSSQPEFAVPLLNLFTNIGIRYGSQHPLIFLLLRF